MTVGLYVVLSICILGLIYLNKMDENDQKKKEKVKATTAKQIHRKSADEISDMYFESLRKIDDMYREFQGRK